MCECFSPIFTICCKTADAEIFNSTLLLRHLIVQCYLFRRQFCPKFGAQFFSILPWTNFNLANDDAQSPESRRRQGYIFQGEFPLSQILGLFFLNNLLLSRLILSTVRPSMSQRNFEPLDVWRDQHLKTIVAGPAYFPTQISLPCCYNL